MEELNKQHRESEELADLDYIVSIRPGSASGSPFTFQMPESRLNDNMTFGDIVRYALNEAQHSREEARIIDAISGEMEDSYGLTVEGEAVKERTLAKEYFRKNALEGMEGLPFLGLNMIVSSRQTGGVSYRR